MKKLLLAAFVLLGGLGAFITPTYAEPAHQVCAPDSPCLYTGYAKCDNFKIYITVKMDKNGQPIASFRDNNKDYTVYVFIDNNGYYVNHDGRKYYFNM
ncbi:MAG: hypothetical protein J1F05_01965 [Muribaculaceae bacterium]|nr:hypothetical protein [Muribaculaceae bacterium]